MRKTITVLAVGLIAIALVGPGIMGRVAERAVIENNDGIAAALPGWLELVEQRFDRGWFTSRSRYRLVITDPERVALVAGLLGNGAFADQPAINVESRVAHGPLVGLITPALARVESRFVADTGEGEPVVLPVQVTSTLGFTGTTQFDWLVNAGEVNGGPGSARWEDISLRHVVDGSLTRTTFALDTPHIVLTDTDGERIVDYSNVDIDVALMTDAGVLNSTANYAIEMQGAATEGDVAGDIALDGISLSALPAVNALLQDLRMSGQAEAQAALQRHLPAIRALLNKPVTLNWQQSANTINGPMDTNVSLALPIASALPPGSDLNLIGRALLERSAASIDLSVGADYVAAADTAPPEIRQAITMMRGTGMLVENESGDRYESDVDYADGLLTVNGFPMPVAGPPAP